MAGWSKKRVTEFKAAFSDFLRNCKIDSKETGGDSPLILYGAQKRFLNEVFDGLQKDIHYFVVLKARQLGISTVVRALLVFWAYVHPGLRIALVYDTDSNKEDARQEIKRFVEVLPGSHRLDTAEHNRYHTVFPNGSRIAYFVAGIKKSKGSGGLGRSRGINCAGCTEISSWGDIEGLRAFERSLAETFHDRLYIWESTARGFNIFHEMWEDAKADDLTKKAIFIGWWAKEIYRISEKTHPEMFKRYGTEPPDEHEQARIDLVAERYGHVVDQEQLAWYRHEFDPNREGDDREHIGQDIIQQELPWCVVAGTRVGTDAGILPIEQIVSGLTNTLGKIVAAGPTGQALTFEIKTRLGYTLAGTGNHPIATITLGKFIDLSQTEGQRIKLIPPRFGEFSHVVRWREGVTEMSVEITPDFARLVGLYMGDGSIQSGKDAYFSIACDRKDQDVVLECKRLLRNLFDVNAPSRVVGTGCEEVCVGSRLIVDTFRKLGLARNDTGPTQRKVHVPEFIWRSPKHVVREFLRGLFEADGFNDYGINRVVLFSKWPDFLKDVQLLLLAFGITCKRQSRAAKTSYTKDGVKRSHNYTANELILRSNEAIAFNEQIGFLSARKSSRFIPDHLKTRKRHGNGGATRLPLLLEDDVVEIANKGLQTVYNVTVQGQHLFDANGILTHNTEEEAFLLSGSEFFPGDRLTETMRQASKKTVRGYNYYMTDEFTGTVVEPAKVAKKAWLKVWQEPEFGATYVLGADPAYGSSDDSYNHCAQVLRCYADGVEQVAEFCSSEPDTRQFAWALVHLAGAYENCRFLLELNGPGHAVWNEIRNLRTLIEMGYLRTVAEEHGLTNIFRKVRDYMWAKEDSIQRNPSAFHWETNTKRKIQVMERLRALFNVNALTINSIECIKEMQKVVRDGDSIAGEGTAKYDRVMAMALAVRAWEDGERPLLIRQNRTRVNEAKRQDLSPVDMQRMFSESIVADFFQKQRYEGMIQRARERRHRRSAGRWGW